MASMTDYLEDALLDHVMRNIAWSSPTEVHLALFIDETEDDATGTEVSGGSYARQQLTLPAPVNGQVISDVDITFPDMPATTVLAVAIFDAATGGNMLLHNALAQSRTVNSGDNLIFAAGDLIITLN